VKLLVHSNQKALDEGANPFRLARNVAADC
jgi:hypothetical protein